MSIVSKLQQLPGATKKNIALAGTGVIMAVIIAGWFVLSPWGSPSLAQQLDILPSRNQDSAQQLLEPFNQLTATVTDALPN